MFVDKAKAKVEKGEHKASAKRPVCMCCNGANCQLVYVFANCFDCHKKELEKAAVTASLNVGKRCKDATGLEQDEGGKSKQEWKTIRK